MELKGRYYKMYQLQQGAQAAAVATLENPSGDSVPTSTSFAGGNA